MLIGFFSSPELHYGVVEKLLLVLDCSLLVEFRKNHEWQEVLSHEVSPTVHV